MNHLVSTKRSSSIRWWATSHRRRLDQMLWISLPRNKQNLDSNSMEIRVKLESFTAKPPGQKKELTQHRVRWKSGSSEETLLVVPMDSAHHRRHDQSIINQQLLFDEKKKPRDRRKWRISLAEPPDGRKMQNICIVCLNKPRFLCSFIIDSLLGRRVLQWNAWAFRRVWFVSWRNLFLFGLRCSTFHLWLKDFSKNNIVLSSRTQTIISSSLFNRVKENEPCRDRILSS